MTPQTIIEEECSKERKRLENALKVTVESKFPDADEKDMEEILTTAFIYGRVDDLRQILTSALTSQREETLEQSRIILMRVLDEVEKENGNPSVYFDMIEELYTDEIDTLIRKLKEEI